MIKRRDYLTAAGAISVGTLSGLAGCAGGSDWNREIGVVTPQSGPFGFIGEGIIQGAQVAIDEVNQNSDAEDISLSIADSEGSVEPARNAVQNAIEDGSVGITGTISSDVTLSVRQLLEEEEVPQVTPIAGNPEITQPGTNFSFRLPGDEEQKEFGTLQFLNENDVSSIAVIGADFSYPQTTVEFLREYAPEFDIEVNSVSFVPLGTDNFRPELNNIDDETVDALFLPYPGANGVTLIQQIREAGMFEDNIVLGDYGYGSLPYRQALGEDIIDVNNWGADLTNEKSQDVISRVRDRFDTDVAIYHLLGYDSIMVLGSAINNAESVDPISVRDSIRETEYDAASGWTVTFDEDGHCDTYRLIVNQWEDQDGQLVNARRFRSDVIPASPSR